MLTELPTTYTRFEKSSKEKVEITIINVDGELARSLGWFRLKAGCESDIDIPYVVITSGYEEFGSQRDTL